MQKILTLAGIVLLAFASAALGADPAKDLFVLTGSPGAGAPQAGGGVINIGQALGPILQPYVDAAVQAFLVVLLTWIGWVFKNKLGINIDEQQRNALIAAAQRQASSLVADGFVKIEQGGKITVGSDQLAAAANTMLAAIPDAAKHFDLTPDAVKDRIIDALPHVPAVSQAQATAIKPQ